MPTTNPVPSTDPTDLLFNAGKLDEVVNGTANSFTDRLGVARRTVAGMNADFDAQLADAESDLNVYRADAAASAAEALGYLQTIRATSYGAHANDPTTDPLGNPPTEGDEYWSTTAKLLKRWNGTTWQASDINTANLAASSGSSLVGYDGGTVQDALDGAKSLQDYAALRAYTGRANRIYITGLLVTAKPAGIAGTFQHDPTDTTSLDNGGTIIVGTDGRRWKRDFSGSVDAKWFGAKADGVTDDTAAIKAANAEVLSAPILTVGSNWTTRASAPTLKLPRGTYYVKGDRIFGSTLADGAVTTKERRRYEIDGCGSVIVWDIQSATDRLFNFDYLIDGPSISNLTIFVINSAKSIQIGGDVFHYNSFSSGGASYHGPSGGLYESVFVNLGTVDGYGTRPAHVFKSIGTNMSDQTIVFKCGFNYFQKLFYSENSQSVNWTFSACGFFGGGGGTINTVYFDFTEMDDNFNVENCSFSVYNNETLLKNRSELSGGVFTQTANFNFNFLNNRFELYGAAGTTWNLCDINFGRFNLQNTNFRIASGAQNVKTIVSAYGVANLNFDGVTFNPVKFRFPVLTNESITGSNNAYGAILRNCQLQNQVEYYFWNGTTEYALKDSLIGSAGYARHVRFDSVHYLNGNGLLDFDLAMPLNGLGAPARTSRSISFSTYGVALGNAYKLPPFQQIKRVTVSMFDILPSTYSAFRLYFGDVSLGNYIDVANVRPSTDVRRNFTLFEGSAAVFNADLEKQSITVFILDNGVERGSIFSQITVEYEPLDCRAIGITTNADTIKVNRNVRAMIGATAQRPTVDLYAGQTYFDTTLGKPIWYNGSVWKDAAGTTV